MYHEVCYILYIRAFMYLRVKVIHFCEFLFITAISNINIHLIYLENFLETFIKREEKTSWRFRYFRDLIS